MACTEIALGALQPKTLTQVEETDTLELPLDAIIDAKSVFEAIQAADQKTPNKQSLQPILAQQPENGRRQRIHKLLWAAAWW